jgi:glycosyltransferase involved in cell wall biosynthesis
MVSAVATRECLTQSRSSAQSRSDSARLAHRPLRICMVAYSFYETDNRVMRYAETLADRGDHVDVLALQRENLPRKEILSGVNVFRLQRRELNEKGRFSYLARITQFLLRATYQVSARHLRQKYDFVHVHSVPDFLVFSAVLPRLSGTPVVLDIHDILPEFYNAKFGAPKDSMMFRMLHGVEKVSGRFSGHVIVANHIWQKRLISRSIDAEKCSVMLNSPDRAIFEKNLVKPARKERQVLLYPGSINWHQGLDIAITAFKKVADQAPLLDFHIYGEGPLKPELLNLVDRLGLKNRVIFHKPIVLREMAKVIQAADLGIVPKRNDNFGNEAFSTKILEFMAAGVPVIVPDTLIDKFYFDDSVVCFFNAGDEDDLARCILKMIRDPELGRVQAEKATRFIDENDWTSKKQEYLQLVDDMVEQATVKPYQA